jgi:hypothetical protein
MRPWLSSSLPKVDQLVSALPRSVPESNEQTTQVLKFVSGKDAARKIRVKGAAEEPAD